LSKPIRSPEKLERSGAVQRNAEVETRPEFESELSQHISPDVILSHTSHPVTDSLGGAERITPFPVVETDFPKPGERQAEPPTCPGDAIPGD
jgi:hypothetical protein